MNTVNLRKEINNKNCLICNAEFEPYVPHAKFCSNTCRNTNVRNTRKLKADSLPKKKCLFCNKDVNRPSREYKYCSDKCHRAMNCKKVCDRAKKKVRENHAKKPPIHCKTCNVELETTPMNYHKLEFCPPCREIRDEERDTEYREKNKERLTTYFKERHAKKMQDPEWVVNKNARIRAKRADPNSWYNSPRNHIAQRLRRNLRSSLKNRGVDKEKNTIELVDYTIDEFHAHIESLFDKPKWNGYEWVDDVVGYSWGNSSEWHIDHIRPVASFNFNSEKHPDVKKCFALNNLQPLWAEDNIRKGDEWDGVVNA